MTLEEAIKVMDVNMCGESSNVAHAWDVISAALEESTNSSHNKRSTPLQQPCDSCGRILTARFYCPVCDNDE
jgi:hypothetical protein